MTPRNVEARPNRATGSALPPDAPLPRGFLWSAETENRARTARKAQRRAEKRAERYRARADRLAKDIRNLSRRIETRDAQIAELKAELETTRQEVSRLCSVLHMREGDVGTDRLEAATTEMYARRPAGRHTRKDQT